MNRIDGPRPMKRLLHGIAVAASLAVPVLLLAGMAGQAEWQLRGGVVIRVPITGYDPRDPLRGHFLRYRIVWNWEDGDPAADTAALCVTSRTENPPVRPLPQGASSCRLPLRLQSGRGPAFLPVGVSDQLFVPEEHARALQSALSAGTAHLTVDLSVGGDGTARVKDWHVDGTSAAEWSARK